MFGCKFSGDGAFYRAVVVAKEGSDKAKVQFIDFGNYEVKLLSDLLNIPKELSKEVSYAVGVDIQNSLQDTEENRTKVEQELSQDNLTVAIVEGVAEFAVDGKRLEFQESNPSNDKSESVCGTDEKTSRDEELSGPKQNDSRVQDEDVKVNNNSHDETSRPKPVKSKEPCSTQNTASPQDKDVKINDNSHEENSKPIKSKIPCSEGEPEVRKAGKIFSDAIANLKSQDHKTVSAKPSVPAAPSSSRSYSECPWRKGDEVVVRSVTGVWEKASVLEVRPDRNPGVLVSTPGSPPMWKRTKDIRSSCVPLDALNLIEKDLNANNVRPQGDGEVAEKPKSCLPQSNVVGKVRDWMDKNIDVKSPTSSPPESSPKKMDSTKVIPQGPKLVTYIQNSAGSNHIQAVLSTSNLNLAR